MFLHTNLLRTGLVFAHLLIARGACFYTPSYSGRCICIKKYFKKNPHKIEKYLFQNKRYIFFRPTNRLPTGSGGAELVAGRSIATDKSLYPAGGLAFIMAKKPILDSNNRIAGWKNFVRFVLDQDTGSAIKGKGRADLYFGTGEKAGAAAGHYMQRGKLFYLVRK